jgi:hypothetical protein
MSVTRLIYIALDQLSYLLDIHEARPTCRPTGVLIAAENSPQRPPPLFHLAPIFWRRERHALIPVAVIIELV